MKWWWFLTVFFIAVIQTTFLKYLEINGVVPNVLLVLAALAIIFYDFGDTWLYLIFTGLILDVFSDFRIGVNLAALVVTAFFFDLFVKNFFNRRSALTCVFLGFFGLLFFYSFSTGLNFIFMKLDGLLTANFVRSSVIFSFIGVLYNFLIFIPALFLWRQFTPLETYQH